LRTNGSALGAVSISLPRIRLNEELQQQLIAAIRRAAAEIAAALNTD
jgi:DNA-binding IclR family transcriptional regulator